MKKILFFIYTLIVTLITAVLLFLPFSRKLLDSIYDLAVSNMHYSFTTKFIYFLVFAVFLLLSLYFLFSIFKKNKQALSVRRNTEFGELTISLASVESIAQTSIKNLKGIKDFKVEAVKNADGVEIILKLVIYPEVIVTELTKKIQSMVKSDVETATGLDVIRVVVKIENVTAYMMRSTAE